MEIKRFDINESVARTAKEINSFREYVEGSATNKYLSILNDFKIAVEKLIEHNSKETYPATSEQMELVEYYCEKYSSKLAAAINRENSIEAMCPSIMISGAGNFPVRKKEKQNYARENFWKECGELFKPTSNYYYGKIANILTNTTIYSNDEYALEKLKNKLSDLEEKHARMKEYNAYYRKHKTVKGFDGISDDRAAEIDKSIEDSWYKQPCAPFTLSNNNAEMKRLKKRISDIERLKSEAEKPVNDKYPNVDGVEVVENAEAMRIQLIFDGKPDDETRTLLKSNGFHWSTRYGAWQRQLTQNGIYATKKVLEKLHNSNKEY